MKAYRVLKRVIDLILAVTVIAVGWPLFLILMLIVRLDSPGPALFKQPRFGKQGKVFNVYKLRTMYINAPANMPTYQLEDADDHITRVGQFLRKTSLDETPQIFNILCGQMSFIGPRPVVTKEQRLNNLRKKYGALEVLPGITGWAQVHGRDTVSADEKAKLDGYYASNISMWLDLKIFFMTIWCVVTGSGIKEGRLEPDAAAQQEHPSAVQADVQEDQPQHETQDFSLHNAEPAKIE